MIPTSSRWVVFSFPALQFPKNHHVRMEKRVLRMHAGPEAELWQEAGEQQTLFCCLTFPCDLVDSRLSCLMRDSFMLLLPVLVGV